MDRQREKEIDAEVTPAGWTGLFLLLVGFIAIVAATALTRGIIILP